MTTTGAELVAPSHEVGGWFLTDIKHPLFTAYFYFYNPGGSQGYVNTGAIAHPLPGHPNFPYGHAVGSDRV